MTNLDKQLILGALDSLALALTNHGHTFSEGERAIYEQARELLGAERMMEDEPWGDEE